MSRAIDELEKEPGVAPFARTTQNIRKTRVGQRFLKHVRVLSRR